MSKPPKEIDGAKVIEWAWSGSEPFGVVCFESGEVAAEIFGLAIFAVIRAVTKSIVLAVTQNGNQSRTLIPILYLKLKKNCPLNIRT